MRRHSFRACRFRCRGVLLKEPNGPLMGCTVGVALPITAATAYVFIKSALSKATELVDKVGEMGYSSLKRKRDMSEPGIESEIKPQGVLKVS